MYSTSLLNSKIQPLRSLAPFSSHGGGRPTAPRLRDDAAAAQRDGVAIVLKESAVNISQTKLALWGSRAYYRLAPVGGPFAP